MVTVDKLMELTELVLKVRYETPAAATINFGRENAVTVRLYGIENRRKRTPDMRLTLMLTDPRGEERMEEMISKIKAWIQMVQDSTKDLELHK